MAIEIESNGVESNHCKIFKNSKEIFEFAAKEFSERAQAAVKEKGEFSVVLSGGNTPKAFFDVLASNEECKKNTPWAQIKFFFGDERYVPADDPKSNYHSAQEHLFSKVPVDPKKVFRIPTDEEDPKVAAEKYENIIRTEMHLKEHECPKFDLCYLGLGDNAHTASLWPHCDIVMRYANNHMKDESTQLVADLFVPEIKMHRITLTPNAVNSSEKIIFMVTGAEKAAAVCEVIEGELDPARYPAQLIERVHTPTFWYLDEPAAEKIHLKNHAAKKNNLSGWRRLWELEMDQDNVSWE